ncbi:MAG: glycosyltransferase involved in cell wall biosynthesis [Rickettsiales bacterium]|jgi:glycosyltransferase involved in cell wall biosynthesis
MKSIATILNYYHRKYAIKILSSRCDNKKFLYFTHEWGGGVEFYLQNRIKILRGNAVILVIRYQKEKRRFLLELTFKNVFTSCYFDKLHDILSFLEGIKIDKIYLNQISFFPELKEIFSSVYKVRNGEINFHKPKVTMLVHDFYSICINGNLLKNDTSCCEVLSDCECSLKSGDNFKNWKEFLINGIDDAICFSKSSAEIMQNFHPEISKKIISSTHQVPFLRKVNITSSSQVVRMAVIGFINQIKGCDLISQMAELILEEKINAKIFVVGKFKGRSNAAIKVLGKYNRDDLPEIMEKNQIDIVFIPSICPETFSYTTHEAMMMGLNVACFNLGAQAEYVGKYDKGLIVSRMEAKIALDEIINFIRG